jgi:hypothetical protein
LNEKKQKQLCKFKEQLLAGIAYYKQLLNDWPSLQFSLNDLTLAESKLEKTTVPCWEN